MYVRVDKCKCAAAVAAAMKKDEAKEMTMEEIRVMLKKTNGGGRQGRKIEGKEEEGVCI